MADAQQVKKLAALARIEVKEDDLPRFVREFDAVLAYVGQLDTLASPAGLTDAKPVLRNVFREDTDPTPSETWTNAVVDAFPEKDGDYLKVKQIISHD